MKITKVDIIRHDYNRDKAGKKVSTIVGCRVYTDEGIYGDGEVAGIHANWGSYGVIRDLAKLLIGKNPLYNEAIWEICHKRTFWGQNGGAFFLSGLAALDMALWDIKGKYFNVPLYLLLGGKVRDKLRCYASQLQFGWGPEDTPATKPEDFARNAKLALADGYDAIKVDFFTLDENGAALTEIQREGLLPPKYVEMVKERVAATREAVGPYVDIIMENHCATNVQSAIQLSQAVEEYNIYYFEEPNTPNPMNTRFLKENINMPIAHGERVFGRWEYLPYFMNGSVQLIQPDMGNLGGITETKKICDLAYIFDVGVQLHTCASHLMTPPSIHLEAAIPNFVIHEQHMRSLNPANQSYTNKIFLPKNGYFEIPEDPGAGIEWNDKAMADNGNKLTIQ